MFRCPDVHILLITVVVHDGRILEKPADEDEVRRNIAGYAVSLFGDSTVPSCRGEVQQQSAYAYCSILLLFWLPSSKVQMHTDAQSMWYMDMHIYTVLYS